MVVDLGRMTPSFLKCLYAAGDLQNKAGKNSLTFFCHDLLSLVCILSSVAKAADAFFGNLKAPRKTYLRC